MVPKQTNIYILVPFMASSPLPEVDEDVGDAMDLWDAASLDWHPRWPFVVATGGSSDRFVKIWDLESSLGQIVSNNNSSNHPQSKKEISKKEVQLENHQDNSLTHETSKSDTSSFSVSSNESL